MSVAAEMHAPRHLSAYGLGALAIGGVVAGVLATRGSQPRARGAAASACTSTVAPSPHRRVVQRLLDSLEPGQTGCLAAGVYREDLKVSRSGIVLRSASAQRARIVGRLWVTRRARGDLFSGLILDGRNSSGLPSPTVNGTSISFVNDEVTNENTNICFVLGSAYGRARDTLIEGDRIHNCGRLPSHNTEHGIYVSHATGTRIIANLIYGNADRGIQLYPDAQGSVIERNVIDGNGEGVIFSGEGGQASSNNLVQYNAITNARIRSDIESWYPQGNPAGVGNVVRDNCVWGGRGAPVDVSAAGFTAIANVVADPMYASPAGGDFQISAASRCASLLAGRVP